MLHFVDACEEERGCGASASLEVIVTSSLDFVMATVFGNVDPSFVGLIASLDWVFTFFKFVFEEFVDTIFPSFSRSSNRSVCPTS